MTTLFDQMTRTLGLPCRELPDPFFSDHPMDRQYAAGLCTGCPLLLACGQYAIAADEGHGVWGGMDLDARRNGCGTQLGFFRHSGRGETPCPACRAAHEETVRQDRIRQLAEIHAGGGSVWGAQLHRKLGERPCEGCRAAGARQSAERRARERADAERARGEWDAREAAEVLRSAHAGVQRLAIAV